MRPKNGSGSFDHPAKKTQKELSHTEKQTNLRRAVLAMLKLGFSYADIRSMYEKDLAAWLDAHERIINPKRGKTYLVKGKEKQI